MPGKHAPESPASFYLSVARAVGGALVVLGVVAVIAVAATGSGGKKPNAQTSTPPPTASTGPSSSSAPSNTQVTPTPTTTAPNLSSITVDVLNGTTRAGLASALANKLKSDGYTIKKVANQATHQTATTIYYKAGAKAAAEAMLAAHPELKRVAPATSSTPATVTLTVVIGDDYKAA
ncbi:MAG: LytR family transcriptional regulator [Actinobacteria bacterium]|nr:MAG: LytR family transcriptional regulator [Actinomycetota bacterium]